MEIDRHALLLGRVMVNLHSLEVLVRLTLAKLDNPQVRFFSEKLKVGDQVELDAQTDYSTLGELLDKLNLKLADRGEAPLPREAIVKLRDALAHGRVFTLDVAPMRIFKFEKPERGATTVRVALAETLDETWFQEAKTLVHSAMIRVHRLFP